MCPSSKRPQLARDEGGQAFALGVFFLLILAIGMYMIGTFGHHVRQKIAVQTTADATALSLATLEAQSFNYIAFANRAQVAHYVTMLNLQSLVSYLSFLEYASLTVANYMKIVGELLKLYPPTSAAGTAMSTAADTIKNSLYEVVHRGLDAIDSAAGKTLFDRIHDVNRTLWVTEMLATEIVQVQLGRELGDAPILTEVAARTDPSFSFTNDGRLLNAVFAAHNLKRYNEAFARPGGRPLPWEVKPELPGDHDSDPSADLARAQRVMAEVVNATRYDDFIVKRGVLGHNFGVVPDFVENAFGLKQGESKLVNKADLSTILKTAYDDSTLNRGGVIASNDSLEWKFNIKITTISGRAGGSVWVKAPGSGSGMRSKHCRAKEVSSFPYFSPFFPIPPMPSDTMECKDETQDRNHSYKGIAPYMTYQAGMRHPGRAGDDFHQPDVFAWVFKPKAQAGFPKPIAFTLSTKKKSATLSTEIARTPSLGFLPTGIHAIARAQVYYHRPENWNEPPSLFNPFWRARLAPVAPGLTAAVADLAPGGVLDGDAGGVIKLVEGLVRETLLIH